MGKEDLENRAVGTIVSQPSADDLRPTPEQVEWQRATARWEKTSKKIDWVVGEPAPRYS